MYIYICIINCTLIYQLVWHMSDMSMDRSSITSEPQGPQLSERLGGFPEVGVSKNNVHEGIFAITLCDVPRPRGPRAKLAKSRSAVRLMNFNEPNIHTLSYITMI